MLVAGVDKDARGSVEATVLQAFTGRDSEPWTVSLVRVGGQWSVTLSGPGERFRNLSFSAQQHRLAEAIRDAISGDDHAPGLGSASHAGTHAPQSARSRIRDRHVCGSCQQALIVSYESVPGEPKQPAPVACPHCWSVSRVEIGLWAADGREYVAERA